MDSRSVTDSSIYNEPVKIFIRDVHTLKQDSDSTNYFHFLGKKIRKVDVMGIITEVQKVQDAHLYRVDDGTGEILCRYQHLTPRAIQELQELDNLQELVADLNFRNPSELGEAMEELVEESYKKHTQITQSLDQGCCAHIHGFIADFHEMRQINAYKLYEVTNYKDEIDRIFELSHLYTKVYNLL